uniref:RING-H2 finger protein ATL7 n=1 Tax=Anthurium amnicola TaxID=1678845 RepID=A0A1D1YKF6_9ARAE
MCHSQLCKICWQPEHVISGLEPDVVAAFPTKKYNRESSSFHEDAQCSICLGEYQENEVLRIMPTCGHEFHRSCIDLWLEKQSTCPICRLSLDDSCEAKDAASSFHYGRGWALPRAERPRWRDNNQEIHEALRIDLEATAAAQPGSRR